MTPAVASSATGALRKPGSRAPVVRRVRQPGCAGGQGTAVSGQNTGNSSMTVTNTSTVNGSPSFR